jgi:type VI secretion system protein ImpF
MSAGAPPVPASLLDRLAGPAAEGQAAWLAGVARDIEALLNTQIRPVTPASSYAELARSLANYGMPDLTLLNLADETGRRAAARLIEEVLRRHEPRLRDISVTLLGGGEPLDRTLRFRIRAVLLQPGSDRTEVAFLSRLEATSGRVAVERTRDA